MNPLHSSFESLTAATSSSPDKICRSPLPEYPGNRPMGISSSLYGSASKTHLQKIECFQYKCLRLIIGALKSTPRSALCAETGIYPLHFRRNYITDRILVKLVAYQHSIILFNINFILNHWRFTEWRLPLLCKRAKLIFRLQSFITSTHSYCLSLLSYHQTLN